MIQKKAWKKKRKKHKPSMLHRKDGTCYLCMKLDGNHRLHSVTQEHHIFGGPNRQISEAEGLKVYLCLAHHIDGPEAVHNNHKNMRLLQKDGQRAYECSHTREEFMERFGRNYLGDEKEAMEITAKIERDRMRSTAAGISYMVSSGGLAFSDAGIPSQFVPPGFTPIKSDCDGCFGAAGNDCERCREERNGEKK